MDERLQEHGTKGKVGLVGEEEVWLHNHRVVPIRTTPGSVSI